MFVKPVIVWSVSDPCSWNLLLFGQWVTHVCETCYCL